MSKIIKCPFTLIGWLLGDLVPRSFMSKIAIWLNPRANHTANMSADSLGQWRRALRQQVPPLSGLLILYNKVFYLIRILYNKDADLFEDIFERSDQENDF